MTKSKRSKKNRQADFKKPKIKLGKKLKRPLNETKTDFKARKIIIKDQLPEKDNKLISKKNTNIKDTLCHMNHHSVYVRQDGINDLKAIIELNPPKGLLPHLSSIIHGTSAAICDTDRLIRGTAFKLIEALISKMDAQFDPYFPILSSHLSCALVSMNTDIQADSFTLMNILISHRPALLIENATSLLPKFLSMIATKVSSSQPNKRSSTRLTYALSFAPDSKMNSLRHRLRILKTLSIFLESLIDKETSSDAHTMSGNWHIILSGSLPSSDIKSSGNFVMDQKENELKSFFGSLSPLLFHTWVEVQSSETKGKDVNYLSKISYEILGCIINILLQITKITKLMSHDASFKANWAKEHFEASISKMLQVFPCIPSAPTENSESKTDFSIHDLNIGIALLSLHLFEYKNKIKMKLPQYLIDLFENSSFDSQYKIEDAINLSCFVVCQKTLSPDIRGHVLISALKRYQRASTKAQHVFNSLFLAVLDWNCCSLWRMKSFKKWIQIVLNENEAPHNDSLDEIVLQMKLRNIPGYKEANIALHKQNKMPLDVKIHDQGYS